MLNTLDESRLCQQLCANVKLHKRKNGMVMLETPFTFPDGDQYALYLDEMATGGIRLSDGGTTLIQLSYETEPNKFFEGTRNVLFEQVVSEQGVNFDDQSGQFYVETTAQNLPQAVFQLGQTMTRIYDLTFLNRSRVVSTFYDDLKNQLTSILPESQIQQSYEIPNLPNAANYPVDFCFEGKSGNPVFLFGVPNKDKARLTTIFLQHYLQHGIEFDSLLVFEDQEVIARRDLARLSNVGGEQISSLSAFDDFQRKVKNKAA